jgi:hypothetical protein
LNGKKQVLKTRSGCGDIHLIINTISEDNYEFNIIEIVDGQELAYGNSHTNYSINYGDGTPTTSSVLGNAHRFFPQTHSYSPSSYPYKVTVTISGGECVIEHLIKKGIHEFQVVSDPLFFNFHRCLTSVTNEGVCRWSVDDIGFYEANGYHSIFKIDNRNPAMIRMGIGKNIVKLGWLTPNVHFYSVPEIINVDCGFKDRDIERDEDKTINGSKWTLNCEHWVEDNWFSVSIGAVSKTYRKGFLGIWYPKNAEQITVNLNGQIIDRGTTAQSNYLGGTGTCRKFNLPNFQEIEANSAYVERDKNDIQNQIGYIFNEPATQDNSLFSTHKARVSGVVWGRDNLKFE